MLLFLFNQFLGDESTSERVEREDKWKRYQTLQDGEKDRSKLREDQKDTLHTSLREA